MPNSVATHFLLPTYYVSAGRICSPEPGSVELRWTQSPVCSHLDVTWEWLVLDGFAPISGGCMTIGRHYTRAWIIAVPGLSVCQYPSMLSQACTHSSITAPRRWVEACPASQGLSSEPAYPHFPHIVLAKVRHKASSDSRDEKTDSTHWKEEVQCHMANPLDPGRSGELGTSLQSVFHYHQWMDL